MLVIYIAQESTMLVGKLQEILAYKSIELCTFSYQCSKCIIGAGVVGVNLISILRLLSLLFIKIRHG
jgi:hypothetical protein